MAVLSFGEIPEGESVVSAPVDVRPFDMMSVSLIQLDGTPEPPDDYLRFRSGDLEFVRSDRQDLPGGGYRLTYYFSRRPDADEPVIREHQA